MPPLSRRPLLLGLIAVLVVLAVVVTVAVVQRDDGPATEAGAPVAQDRPGPVLLVPGYGGSAESLPVLAEELRAAGRTVTVIEPPGDGLGDLRETARVLLEESERAMDDGAPSVDVVGYSAGGLIARYWAAELGGDAVARRIVTVGSPHHGTSLAALGARVGRCPPGCEQLVPDSDLLTDLNADDETPDGPLWTTIWTDQDETVTPPDSARLDGATQVVVQQVCPGTAVAHGELPQHPLVTALVLEALAVDPPPASYGPQDCPRLSA
jgi:pimeloyl-ACP methyl ester carboxylesterase